MTINVAIVTSDAIVFGCDSISSSTGYFLSPWNHMDQPGGDGSGTMRATFRLEDMVPIVTGSFSGATKMFRISEMASRVAATNAGIAKLDGRTISGIADEFRERQQAFATVEHAATEFLAFVRAYYDQYAQAQSLPAELLDDLEFLIGGYDANGKFPALFRISVKDNTISPLYKDGGVGIAWAGQSDSVERVIFGMDSRARREIIAQYDQAFTEYSDQMYAEISAKFAQPLQAAGVEVELVPPPKPNLNIDWRSYYLDIEVAHLPLQDAIDLAAYLVNLQSGRSKFCHGTPTVGGRTHVGLMTATRSFTMLNEPELVHRNTGFNHDV